MIVWLSTIVASGLLATGSRAEGPEPRVWTLSDDHTDLIRCVVYSPDSATLASSSRDGTIKLWDLATGRVRLTLDAHLPENSYALAFSPDGKTLASSGPAASTSSEPARGARPTGGIALWDVSTGRRRDSLDVPRSMIQTLRFSPDGETLAWIDGNKASLIWDLPGNRLQFQLPLPSRIAAFSPDLKKLAVAASDVGPDRSDVLLYDRATRQKIVLRGHRNAIQSLAFSPDGKTLASGSAEPFARRGAPGAEFPSEIKLWDLTGAQPRERASLPGVARGIGPLAFSPDSRLMVAEGSGHCLRVWDAASAKPVACLEEPELPNLSIAFSPDGRSMAGSGMSMSIPIWDTATWQNRCVLSGRSARCLAYTPDGKTLAAGMSDGTVVLRDVATERVRMVLQGHSQRVSSLAVSADGKRLAAGGDDGVIKVWDPTTGLQRGYMMFAHSGPVTALAIAPDGKTLASGGKDAMVQIWDLGSYPVWKLATFRGHESPVSGVAFSADGKTLASGSLGGTLRFWDVAGRREKAVVKGHTVKVARTKEQTAVVDGETVTTRVGIMGETEDLGVSIYCLAYSPDGKTLATGDRAMFDLGGVSLRDATTGQERASFKQFYRPGAGLVDILALAYSPDGKTLASAGYSHIRLSDAATGKELTVVKTGILSPIRALAYSPDGKTLASCSENVVQFWDVAAALQRAAKAWR